MILLLEYWLVVAVVQSLEPVDLPPAAHLQSNFASILAQFIEIKPESILIGTFLHHLSSFDFVTYCMGHLLFLFAFILLNNPFFVFISYT